MSYICEHEKCKEKATVNCFYVDSDVHGQPDHTYCAGHAAEEGFCLMCGRYSAGMSGFDFVHPGYCESCHDEIQSDADTEDFDDEDHFEPCSHCDLPDACADFGCAIAQGIKEPDM